ncbi:sensor histidine kinase [Candidatus Halocynthiibacter alkanivorans]|uniref:sensor histidine kinase n=1 Tax=Candidatus Halocynthiibacter alkanivorans TaxID=2267619 RepID=UPI00135A4085|nr:ATP-binding protein [Candidatus Halocynthiibacter alkanivorans]
MNIMDGVSVPVIGLDKDLKVRFANRKARQAFPDLDIGLSVEKAVSEKRKFINHLQETLHTSRETTTSFKAKDGFRQEYLVTAREIEPADNSRVASLVLTFEDRSPLRDAKTMRSDFVANVSHEIRSPLTSISGFVETLQGPASEDAEARELFLELMAKEVARMTNLVTGLLSLSQVEVKEQRAIKKIVDMNLILDQAREAVVPLAQKRRMTVDTGAVQRLPGLLGKHDDLVRMFINLLENAINYSRDGSKVTLSTCVEQTGNPLGKPAVCICIRDEGIGIPADEIPRLTERFYRVDKSRSRNVGGTGLGLAIVKHILVRHRGHLLIDSTPGHGSTFKVCLPLVNSN